MKSYIKGKVIGDYKIKIYNGKNNCRNMHKGFLFLENNLVGDIRYTSKLFDTGNCFNGKVIKK